ncbi:hypothetical protein R6242_14380 [Iodobacter sp. CM08]|uniref:hypothetical protein n=1 Tax=Iodobacter sp. CM08 TaxID=3085902 RepID=UPI0029816998|nr:hypothetical protein [Iodobacter sp. CM08]MDW5417754.1 hypothetical protein [Iodobacter sp. CM08]
MAEAVFEIRRTDGLMLCNLNSLGGVWGGAVSATLGNSAYEVFPLGRGLTMWITYVCLGAHDVQTGTNVDGFPYVSLIPKSNVSRRTRTDTIVQVFFR